ncbi:MAG TPA: XRE family transcriptional regulator [Bacteroidales bacterium]|nr:XRE family transcriptional regulator [Bacteroidales bacterium]
MAINRLIGEKISALRTLKKVPTDDLAEKTGLSVKQLNLIESGVSIPSLGVLIRITRALGIRIGTLLDDTVKEGPAVVRAGEHQSTLSFSTNESRENLNFMSLAPNKAGRHMEPFMIDILPDSGTEPPMSSHEGEEFIYVLEGSITIHYGNDTFKLAKGDSIYLDSVVKHLVTTDETRARILGIVYVPV